MNKNDSKLELNRQFHGLKYLFPIQSMSQFCSFAVCILIGMIAPSVIEWIFGIDLDIPLVSLFLVVLAGGYPSLYFALPYHLKILTTKENENFWMRLLDERFLKFGYKCISSSETGRHYQTYLPRWLRWRENEIKVFYDANSMVISGPGIAIKKLHEQLMAENI